MSGWEKYVAQAAEALAKSTAHVAPTTRPWEGMSKSAKERNEMHALAVLAAVGPLIQEDTRDRMVTAAAASLDRDGGSEQAIRAKVAEEIAVAIERSEDGAISCERAEGIAGHPDGAQGWRDIATGYMRSAEIAREVGQP